MAHSRSHNVSDVFGWLLDTDGGAVVLQVHLCFPEEGMVYDYRLDDAGISNFVDDEEDSKGRKVWRRRHNEMNKTQMEILADMTMT